MRPSTVVVLAACLQYFRSAAAAVSTIPWWNIRLAQDQGPNVCVVEEVPGTQRRIWTECKYWNSRQVCHLKPVLRYECCEGFTQVAESRGCTGVTPLRNLLDTARIHGASKFVKYVEKSGLSQEFTNGGPFTLFAPADEVFQNLTREQRTRLEEDNANYLRPWVMYHAVEGRLGSARFQADLLVPSRYSGHNLRINKYSSRIETVNCVLVQRKDLLADNGVVHIISGLLEPSYSAGRDVAELLVQDGRFLELTRALEKAGLMARLQSGDSHLTVLAPSDEAFTKIKPARLAKIMNDKKALTDLLENHMVPHVMCTPAIIGEHVVQAAGESKVTLDCDRRGVTAGSSRLHPDLTLGSNGVIYMIDNVLVPDRAKTLIQILEEEKLSSFLQLIRFSGLEDAFENFGEYTVFVPSNTALLSLPGQTLSSLQSDREKARRFVLFHATQGRHVTDQMSNNQVILTLDEGRPLRVQLYRDVGEDGEAPRAGLGAAVEGAPLLMSDRECLNGVIHVISRVLLPTNHTAGELLRRNNKHRIFFSAMERVISDNPYAIDFRKPKTLFVPTDEAFRRIGETRLQAILTDSLYLNKVIKNHVCENMLFSESIRPELQYSVPSLLGTLTVIREGGKIKVNDAEVIESDTLTSSGVIHVIDKVLLPDER